jgi:hypothetical protein
MIQEESGSWGFSSGIAIAPLTEGRFFHELSLASRPTTEPTAPYPRPGFDFLPVTV